MTGMASDMTPPVAEAYDAAVTAFRAAISAADPACHFTFAMRCVCDGFDRGVLPADRRAPLMALVLCAEQALATFAVPALLPTRTFEALRARMSDLLTLWCEPKERRATWHPDYAPGFKAMVCILANEVDNVSLMIIAARGVAPTRPAESYGAAAPAKEGTSDADPISHTRH